jgi:DNA-binding CsgD family transcriptional regulator
MFGLTAAETKVAIEIARGGCTAEIASGLNVAEATVRTQLKSILAKTDTHRQAELVGLLTRIAQSNLSISPQAPTPPVVVPTGSVNQITAPSDQVTCQSRSSSWIATTGASHPVTIARTGSPTGACSTGCQTLK